MRLTDIIADALGAEIQPHTVKIGRKKQALFFRQISDAEGREVFRPVDGETPAERGQRVMNKLIAASACDEAGSLISTEEEVAAIRAGTKQKLFEAAALTNGIDLGEDDEEPAEADEDEPEKKA
jgi:hypothetical protein